MRYPIDVEMVNILKLILFGKDIIYHTSPPNMRETHETFGVREIGNTILNRKVIGFTKT